MFDIGFWELLVIGVVLLLVMGPERLPDVAKQAAFFVRKARQGMFRLRNEMQSELEGTPFADIKKAKQEMTELKRDLTQFGRELADSAQSEKTIAEADVAVDQSLKQEKPSNNTAAKNKSAVSKKKAAKKKGAVKKVAKKTAVVKKTAKKTVGTKISPTKKKVSKKKVGNKKKSGASSEAAASKLNS